MLQGHALFTRQAGGANPCPLVDFVGGFNAFFARAYGLPGTVEQTYGQAFNPFLNDQNYFISVVTLEELGATGNHISSKHMPFIFLLSYFMLLLNLQAKSAVLN